MSSQAFAHINIHQGRMLMIKLGIFYCVAPDFGRITPISQYFKSKKEVSTTWTMIDITNGLALMVSLFSSWLCDGRESKIMEVIH